MFLSFVALVPRGAFFFVKAWRAAPHDLAFGFPKALICIRLLGKKKCCFNGDLPW